MRYLISTCGHERDFMPVMKARVLLVLLAIVILLMLAWKFWFGLTTSSVAPDREPEFGSPPMENGAASPEPMPPSPPARVPDPIEIDRTYPERVPDPIEIGRTPK